VDHGPAPFKLLKPGLAIRPKLGHTQAMADHSHAADGEAHPGMGFREFVTFIAAVMAINALGIDTMLPALPDMGRSLGIAQENQRQWIIAAFVFGFGSAQLFYGPLADRFGRRPILIGSIGMFVVTSIVAAYADSFATMIAARLLQGISSASTRVLAISMVRDCYSGRRMARVMSLAFMIFMGVPVLAPSIGQLILLVAPWPAIFFFLAGFGAIVVLWAALRLPETLRPEQRRAIAPREVIDATRTALTDRTALGYTLASTMLFGSLMGFIVSSQQIFADTFHVPDLFPIIFALAAGTMGVAAFFNSRIVERLGTRRVSHSALIGFIGVSALHLLCAAVGLETVWSFAIFQSATVGCFALAGSNFGSMAMEPVGHIAGTASSIQGFISTVGGALIGTAIGQSFDGTTVPVAAGYLIVGVAALLIVLVTERGRLFRPHHASPAQTCPAQ
jgi:MFS transporter, DHA1 family, multidrug resistance protein